MYDNTVIAIYGDHQGMNKETPSVQWKMTDSSEKNTTMMRC